MLHFALLAVHVTAGVTGLLVGPAAMAAALRDDREGRAVRAYRVAVAVLTATAAGLVTMRPAALWPFLILAGGTLAAALGARRAPTVSAHVRLVCGSYVALVTALAVVSWGSILAWVLPTVIGSAFVEWAAASTRRRPPARTPSHSPTPWSRP